MVLLAQLVRALVCGSRGRQFESDITPLVSYRHNINFKINLPVCFNVYYSLRYYNAEVVVGGAIPLGG